MQFTLTAIYLNALLLVRGTDYLTELTNAKLGPFFDLFYSAFEFRELYCSVLNSNALECSAPNYSALDCNTLNINTLDK